MNRPRPGTRRRTAAALLLALAPLAACASSPEEPLPATALEEARALYEAGDPDAAWGLLNDWDVEDFDLSARRDYALLTARVSDALGDWDRAVRYYELALDEPGPASEQREIEERLLTLGIELLQGKRKVLFFFPDRSRGVATLEHLAFSGRFPEIRAEALARLADYHFRKGDYVDAELYYDELLAPELRGLGYEDLAAYRVGECTARRVDVDHLNLDLPMRAIDQFEAYMKRFPNGLHRSEAEERLAWLRELVGRYQLQLADFYRVVGNDFGRRYHLQLAAGMTPLGRRDLVRYVQGTAAAEEAKRLLAELGPAESDAEPSS